MNNEQNNAAFTGMTTLSECIDIAASRGFTVQFIIHGRGLSAAGQEKFYTPGEILIDNFYRFEGASDPEDTSIMYLIETTDGTKGTLVDAYGLYADNRVTEFMSTVQGIHKSEAE